MRAMRSWVFLGTIYLLTACEATTDNPASEDDAATGQVKSNESGTITTPQGAKLTVPMYAVPLTTVQGNGTISFSIEKTSTVGINTPAGEAVASDAYRFGPDGFTFARPVRVTIPVPDATTAHQVTLYRINPTTGVAQPVPSEFDVNTQTVSGMTSELSVWMATTQPVSSSADGAIRLINSSATMWLNSCVVNANLTTPNPNYRFGEAGAAPPGDLGWNSTILWHLPQGTYRVCCQMRTTGTLNTPPGNPVFWFVENVVVGVPWGYPNYQTAGDLAFGTPPVQATPGSCPCTPLPTPSAGTGEVQVTLTWHGTQSVDLDLYVTDPSGQTVYYNNATVPSGGTLDRDNQCNNYQDGRPENIFWNTAPAGQYIVVVKWYSSCQGSETSKPFTLRVVNKNVTNTYTGVITPSPGQVEVVRFTK